MNKTKASKYLAYKLRHDNSTPIDKHGWVKLSDLKLSDELICEIVKIDNKQRYELSEDELKIRAVQGHSIEVDVELEEAIPPRFLFHGAQKKNRSSIDIKGLLRMNRLYVHMHDNGDDAFKSGSRKGSPIIYSIKAEQMFLDGYKFFVAKNGVWLTEHVPAKYLFKEESGRDAWLLGKNFHRR